MRGIRSMGQRRKQGMLRHEDNPPEKKDSVDFTILDVSDYEPPHVPLKTWRELIKKVLEVDPLTCPRCGSDLPAIASSGEAGGDEDCQPDPGS